MIIIGLPFLSFAENVDKEINMEDKSEDMIEDNEGIGDLIDEENQDDKDGLGDLIDEEGKGDLIDKEENENLEESQKEEQWNIYYKDKENQKELLQPKTIKSTNNVEDIINDNMEHIDGYKYSSYEVITNNKGINLLYLNYEKVENNTLCVVFNYTDIDTNKPIAKPVMSDDMTKGEKYDLSEYTKRVFDGYEYVKTEGNVSGVIEKNEQVNVYYRKINEINYTVTIKYLDKDTNKEIEKAVIIEPKDKDYDVTNQTQKKIDGYKYVKTEGKVKGNLKNQGSSEIIKVYYEKIENLSNNEKSNVKTGDYNNLLLWIEVALVALIILFAVMRKNKK